VPPSAATQNPSSPHPGCLGRANADGTDGRCLDEGQSSFNAVRVDDTAVYYLKDGDLYRLAK